MPLLIHPFPFHRRRYNRQRAIKNPGPGIAGSSDCSGISHIPSGPIGNGIGIAGYGLLLPGESR